MPGTSARLSRAVLVLLTVASGCAQHQQTSVPPAQSTAALAPLALSIAGTGAAGDAPSATAIAAAATAPAREPRWSDAVRLEKWSDAAALLDALPEPEKTRPEVRYVRARVALALGDSARAAPLLAGLEASLPLLAGDIARYRAEAAVEAGPYAEAAQYFGRSTKARDLVRAARALDRGGDRKAARRMVDKAVTAAQRAKSPRDEATARAERARLALEADLKGEAALDWRWIATHAPASPEAREASTSLAPVRAAMSAKESLDAISDMLEKGAASEALAEIARVESKPGFPKAELDWDRAMALYKARDYAKAVKAFEAAAAAKNGRQAEELYYAARALARSGEVDAAIELYRDVAKRFPTSVHAERSTLLSARLLVQRGKYKDAVTAYARYTSTYPRGDSRKEASYEQTLAMLSSDGAKLARRRLDELARAARGDEIGKLHELEGVAALRDGDRDDAVKLWTDVVRAQPLSWAAMMARSRLRSVGAPLPPLLEPAVAQAAQPLELRLPALPALLTSVGLDADAESYLAASEHAAAAPYAGRESEALCRMYGMLASAKRRYRVGTSAVSYAQLTRAPSQAERWAWECLYPRPYELDVSALEEKHGIPHGLVHALMRQESGFDPQIVSPASAVGLMQLMPATAQHVASELSLEVKPAELTSPEVNLRLGAFYLGKLLTTFQGNLMLAAAAYNAGPTAVGDWLAGGGEQDADVWVARIPYDETRNYVARVVGNLARYQWLDGGDEAVAMLPIELPKDTRVPAESY